MDCFVPNQERGHALLARQVIICGCHCTSIRALVSSRLFDAFIVELTILGGEARE
jgi:hypothetical protein